MPSAFPNDNPLSSMPFSVSSMAKPITFPVLIESRPSRFSFSFQNAIWLMSSIIRLDPIRLMVSYSGEISSLSLNFPMRPHLMGHPTHPWFLMR